MRSSRRWQTDILRVSGSSGKNSYQTLVYKQPGGKKKKPVVVLFYDNVGPEGNPPSSAARSAVIFKNLIREYRGKIRFVAHEKSADSQFFQRYRNGSGDLYGLNGLPSLAIYSLFDVVKGETPQKNDGKIKQVDIMRGAPEKKEGIFTFVSDARGF